MSTTQLPTHRKNHDYKLTTRLLILQALDERGAYGPDMRVNLREIHAYLAGRDDAPMFTAPDSFNQEREELHYYRVQELQELDLIKSGVKGAGWYLLPAGRELLRALEP